MNNQHFDNQLDQRYDINLEFIASDKQAHVLRFCGDVVAQYDDIMSASIGARTHQKGGFNRSPWVLLVRTGSVMWLKKGNLHRVAYGADVKETRSDIQAAHWFGECVRHELECSGVMV